MDLVAILQRGLAAQQAKFFAEAGELYRSVLESDSSNADALHLLGVLEIQQERPDQALPLIRQAVQIAPQNVVYRTNLAKALTDNGDLIEAIECYENAVKMAPEDATLHFNFGVLLRKIGRVEQSAQMFERAIANAPNHASAKCSLALSLRDLGKTAAAKKCLLEAKKSHNNNVAIATNLAILHCDLGEYDEAIHIYKSLLSKKSTNSSLWYNLGNACLKSNRFTQAIEAFLRVEENSTSHSASRYNMAVAQMRLGELESSIGTLSELVGRESTNAKAWSLLGSIAVIRGKFQDAERDFSVALNLDASDAGLHQAIAMCQLTRGDFRSGWERYDSRLKKKPLATSSLGLRLYDGGDLNGKHILLVAEQGFGDTIQFIRYADVLSSKYDCEITVGVPQKLESLLKGTRSVSSVVSTVTEQDTFDCYAPLLSMPRILKQFSPDTFPANTPYLCLGDELVANWKDKLPELGGPRVAIVWQGNPNHQTDYFRSFPLRFLKQLISDSECQFVSLQKGTGADQIAELGDSVAGRIIDLSTKIDLNENAFLDTAAILCNVDLLISCDSAVAHLAGALNRPVWLALGQACDWRWGVDSDRTPWYPRTRLFRQKSFNGWQELFQRMERELGNYAKAAK